MRQIEGRKVEFIYLSDHPDLSVEVIKTFPDAAWDWDSILAHDNMCLEWLKELPDAPWAWGEVPDADRFNFSWVQALPDAPWQWNHMHECDDFNLEWVAEFPDKPWNMFRVSCMAYLSDLKQYPMIRWDWSAVTHSSPVTTRQMIDNDFPWDFSELSFDDVNEEDIEFLRHFKHRFDESDWIDFTVHTDWNLLKKNLDLPWCWYYIEPDDFVASDIKLLYDHRDEINWNKMSIMLPFKLIIANPELPWEVEWLSMNDTVAWDDLKHRDDWDYSFVPCEPVESVVRKWVAANTIKRQFKESISNPNYEMCKRRIYRESKELEQLH